MIKFFRKIRYDLMEKNETGKYLKYAIGEIMLVVIGILIALGINNKVEDHQNISKEKLHLKNLYIELQQIELQGHKENNLLKQRVMRQCTNLLAQIHLQNEALPLDSLEKAVFGIISLPNSEIVFKAYDNLVNTNDLSIIRSDKIKSSLSDVTNAIVFQNETLDWQSQQWLNINQLYINKHFEFLDISPKLVRTELNTPKSAFQNDWDTILKDREFRNIVYNRLLAAGDVTQSIAQLLEKVEICKGLIKQELKTRHKENL